MLSTLTLWLLLANSMRYVTYVLLAFMSLVYVSVYNIASIQSHHLLFNSSLAYDPITVSVLIVAGMIAIWLLSSYSELPYIAHRSRTLNNEWIALIVLLVIALAGLASSNSYLSLFVAVELQSLVLYIMLASPVVSGDSLLLNNTSKISLSYLINAATATGFLLFGIATNSNVLVLVAIVWKLGVIPVHAWSLPILDNLHSVMTAVYLTLAKYGILVVLGILASTSSITTTVMITLGIMNLVVANVLGLLQFRYQRIIAYSSMIQLGYMLLALPYSSSLAISYFELYSFYTVILLVLWTAPSYAQLHGYTSLPRAQLAILVFTLYAVAGLPWMPLFWTKLQILFEINSQSLFVALLSTLLASLIYVRLIKYISFFGSLSISR